jgi:hypothetical protein
MTQIGELRTGLRHCTKINGTFIYIPSLTGRLIVAGAILVYQHSVPNGTSNAATMSQINYRLRNASSTQSITNYELAGRAMQRPCHKSITNYELTGRDGQCRPCPVRDRMLVENSISHKRPSRQGRNVFVFPLMYRLFVNKS